MDYLREGYQNLAYRVDQIWSIIQVYGWHMVFIAIIVYYIYTKILRPLGEKASARYVRYRQWKEEKDYTAKYHKNPDLFSERISAQQEVAEKLQEKYNRQAREFQEKQKEKQERKRQEVLSLLNQSNGHKLGGVDERADSDKSKPLLRSEYLPLMGSGNSSKYRPPKKSKCGGGGCGK